MNLTDHVISLAQGRRIAVIGDVMRDFYHEGSVDSCQDGCLKHVERVCVEAPGGAASAARQLLHAGCEAFLIGPAGYHGVRHSEVNDEMSFRQGRLPEKHRYLADGRIVFRHDVEEPDYAVTPSIISEWRRLALLALRSMRFNAVLLSDYDKGMIDSRFVSEVVEVCRDREVPVVCDAKQLPGTYAGAYLKCNHVYACFWDMLSGADERFAGVVVTDGDHNPVVNGSPLSDNMSSVPCVNHVGAGDCFSAWLALAMGCGVGLCESAHLANCAGRAYVQHRHGRAPWPHEIRRIELGEDGKIVSPTELPTLRDSLGGKRVVVSNGAFRLLHAGHVHTLSWAKQQGDVLVVLVNDDASVSRLRPGQKFLPLSQRLALLASLESVDWVCPFSEDDPRRAIALLAPDCLVKGCEYANQKVPGDQFVSSVRFAPYVEGSAHAADLIRHLKE